MASSHNEDDEDDDAQPAGSQRIDKWLWFARIVRSRMLGALLVTEGKVRVNRVKATKPSQSVRAGDVLTVTIRGRVDIFQVRAPGDRRGPAAEAQRLYEVLTPPGTGNQRSDAPRTEKERDKKREDGRAAKRDRRLS